jgi:hypothetical protein
MLFNAQRALGGALYFPIIVGIWLHHTFVARLLFPWAEAALYAGEESVLVALRECSALAVRVVSGASALCATLFLDRGYYSRQRAARGSRHGAWTSWWKERPAGTLNAVIQRDGLVGAVRRSPSPGSRAPQAEEGEQRRGYDAER